MHTLKKNREKLLRWNVINENVITEKMGNSYMCYGEDLDTEDRSKWHPVIHANEWQF